MKVTRSQMILEAEAVMKRIVPSFEEFEAATVVNSDGQLTNKYLEGVPGYDPDVTNTEANDEWSSQENAQSGFGKRKK